jgi:hypothetical protein
MTVRLLQWAWRFSRNELSGKPGAVQSERLTAFHNMTSKRKPDCGHH